MEWLKEIARRFRFLLRRDRTEQDLDQEIRAHLDIETDENIAAGLPPEEARYAARRAFGNLTSTKESIREVWLCQWWENFLQDFRYGVRSLVRTKGFTAVAVLSLTLGIGATTTVFSALHGVVFRQLPYPDADRLISTSAKPGVIAEWEKTTQALEEMAVLWGGAGKQPLPIAGQGVMVEVRSVGPGLLEMLGGRPILGRGFRDEDKGRSAIISYRFWRTVFQQKTDVIGRKLVSDWNSELAQATIVGVLSPDGTSYRAEPWWSDVDIWLLMDPANLPPFTGGISIVGRLKAGATIQQAQAELDTVAARLEEVDSRYRMNPYYQGIVVPLRDRYTGRFKESLIIFMTAVGLVLAIACANVATLLLSRSTVRAREMASRAALGAGRGRLLRQLLTESLLLAVLGGAGGVLLTFLGVAAVGLSLPGFEAGLAPEIQVDSMVLCFALLLSTLTGLLFGLVPALRASRPNLHDALKQGTRQSSGADRRRLQRVLVGVEVALAAVLLSGAALMTSSFVRLIRLELGFNPDNVLTLRFDPLGPKYSRYRKSANSLQETEILPAAQLFYDNVLSALHAIPGVTSAAYTSNLPTTGACCSFPVSVGGREPVGMSYRRISETYFDTLEMPLIRGRSFGPADTVSSLWVAIINERAAKEFFSGTDPLGKHLRVTIKDYASKAEILEREREIIGIVADAHDHYDRRSPPRPTVYVPHRQVPPVWPGLNNNGLRSALVIRTQSAPMSYRRVVQQAIAHVDPQQVAHDFQTLENRVGGTVDDERYWMSVLGVFAGCALFLAAMGLYGVISYSCAQRTHEFGIRMALGGRRSDVLKLVLMQGLALSGVGAVFGIGASLGLTRFIESQLYGVTPTDPETYFIVCLLLVGVALAASYIPARRATKIDPMVALRHE